MAKIKFLSKAARQKAKEQRRSEWHRVFLFWPRRVDDNSVVWGWIYRRKFRSRNKFGDVETGWYFLTEAEYAGYKLKNESPP